MTLTTAHSRHARSFSHRTLEPTTHANATSILGGATEEELNLLRCLLNDCLREADETARHIGQRVLAFPLVNFSPFATECRVDRVDHAAALVGDQWLNSLAFAQGLATHLRRRIGTEAADEAMLRVWQEAMMMSNAAELMCRVTMTAPSHHGWICGLLLGATEICARIAQLHPKSTSNASMRRRGSFTIELSRLLTVLGCDQELTLFDPGSLPTGPWNALSAAVELTHTAATLDWAQLALLRIHPLNWPASLSDILAERIAELEGESFQFAAAVWERAVQ